MTQDLKDIWYPKLHLTLSGRLRCSLGNHHSLNRFGAKRLEPGSADRRFYRRRRWCVFAAPVEFTGAVRNELMNLYLPSGVVLTLKTVLIKVIE